MTEIAKWVPEEVLAHLSERERVYLSGIFSRFNGYPSLEEIWALMDEPWVELECDPTIMDERIDMFYQHPIWLLNGLFVERHAQSYENLRVFKDWVVSKNPLRVADFGGGFGGLARMIGDALPAAKVEIVDPNPHPAAV